MASSQGIKAGSAFIELLVNDDKLVKGLQKAGKKLKAFGDSIAGWGKKLAGIGTAVAAPLIGFAKAFADGVRGDGIHAEMLAQLAGLPTSSLLFCRHLTRVEIVGDLTRAWELAREDHNPDRSTVVLQQNGKTELWKVYRHSGQVSDEAAESSSGGRRDFEVAVAVPDADVTKPGGSDPLNSNAVRTVTRFDLVEGSGASWYSMVETVDEESADAGSEATKTDKSPGDSRA